MARIRTIKPEFFSSEDIVSMTPLARLFYVSLWCESDRAGRLEWKPGTFKMRYFPGDACSIPGLADELIERGLIVLYEVDGKVFAEIPTFREHQVINNREGDSVIPPRVSTPLSRVKAEGKEGKEGKGKEGKGKEGTNTPPVDFADEPDEFEFSDEISMPTTDAERALCQHVALVKPFGKRIPACPHDEIVALYHEFLPGLPRAVTLMESRKRLLAAFWKWVFESKKSNGEARATSQPEALEWTKAYFERASDNEFVMANGKRSGEHQNWKAGIDYLLSEKGRVQVIEKTKEAA